MQGIHTHIPKTNHVPRGYIVAAILSLLFMVPLSLVPALALLFFYVSTYWSTCAVPNMAVFCSFLTWFPGMSLTYFVNGLEMVPIAPIITGITLDFTFYMCCISIVRSLYFKIFSASFSITFLSPEIATSINVHVPFSLSRIIMSGLLLGKVLSVCNCWSHSIVTLPPWFVTTYFGTCSYRCFLVQLQPYFLAYVEVYLHTHFIMPFYILFFCHYWVCWYYMVYCLIKLLAQSAFAIHFCV